ncbi:MAG: uroporphyrinogen decarboxylase [Chloroflexi bacterium]|nr:uroporphyrinogen decarboxylase [Chloroflexota bacterium]
MTGAERLLAACRGEPVDTTPVWFMRQAGGSLPGYLALREQHSVLEIAKSPALCAEVTVLAAETLGTDGAIMFADVMLPVEAMGVALSLAPSGPVIERPIRTAADVARLRTIDPATDLGPLLEAIGLVRRGMGERAAVIGLAGGPFTIAAYMVEGGPSRDQLAAKRLMFGDPGLWADLLDRITDASVSYVEAQVRAGAQVIQLFDSWAGSLGPEDYDRSVAPWTARILAAVRAAGVPVIHFAAAGSALLERLARGADVVGVDSGQSLAAARDRLPGTAVQGNLDPARLAAGWDVVTEGAATVLAAHAGRPGHIFNTGHAVPRDTAPEVLRDLVAFVHERGAAGARPFVTVQGAAR